MEKVHIKYLKIILGVLNNLSNLAVHGARSEMGHFPLVIRQKVKSLKYWSRIVSMSDQSLEKLMYTKLLGLNNVGFKTWVANIENMLTEAALTKVWEDQACSVVDNT